MPSTRAARHRAATLCPRFGLPRLRLIAAVCSLAAPAAVLAQATAAEPAGATRLSPVVVTATRTEANPFDVPASIDRIGGEAVREGRPQINISESLGSVPGLLARDRQNYAQDVQISVRGFGARSTFGIRGVRLYVDGIPATLPDGQGQITNVELSSVGRIEVLRGPFSALYGNSSGGVVQVFTESPPDSPRYALTAAGGSDGAVRFGVKASGTAGGIGYVASASHFRTDGYRDHSAAERNLGNVKLTLAPDGDSKLTLIANSVQLPKAQDPLGLTRAQFAANPRGVDSSALDFNTRKTVNQTQGGVVYERRLGSADSIQWLGYLGHRGTVQFQAIPTGPQGNPLHPGGVIDLARDYQGTDLRWTHKGSLLDAPLTLVGGLAYDTLSEHRRGYQNFIGTTQGVQGALRRDEGNDVSSRDQYVQGTWQLTQAFSVNAGIRHSRVSFESKDAYIVGPNVDDSGGATYSATLPVLGVMYALATDVHLYATAGRGFETPTLNELAYRPNGQTGLNFALQSATSNSVELGVKSRLPLIGELNAAVFQTKTDHEIVTQTNQGGRTTYQNAGATRRLGLELGWANTYAQNWQAQAAYTLLSATYQDPFTTCVGTTCNIAVAAGNRIPGIARSSLFASLNWAPPAGWRAGVEWRALGRVYVNDQNDDAAGGFATASATVGYLWRAGPVELSGFVRVDNLFDRGYAGSVIVNEGNRRYFEPAPGRTWLASMTAAYKF